MSESKTEVAMRGGVGRERGGAVLVKMTSSFGDSRKDLSNEIVYDFTWGLLGRKSDNVSLWILIFFLTLLKED